MGYRPVLSNKNVNQLKEFFDSKSNNQTEELGDTEMTETQVTITTTEYLNARIAAATTDKTRQYWQGLLANTPEWLEKQVASGKRTLADATPEGRKAKARKLNAKKASKTRKANRKASKAKSTPQTTEVPVMDVKMQDVETSVIKAVFDNSLLRLSSPITAIKAMTQLPMESKKAFNKAVWSSKNEAIVKFRTDYGNPEFNKQGNRNLYRNMLELAKATQQELA